MRRCERQLKYVMDERTDRQTGLTPVKNNANFITFSAHCDRPDDVETTKIRRLIEAHRKLRHDEMIMKTKRPQILPWRTFCESRSVGGLLLFQRYQVDHSMLKGCSSSSLSAPESQKN